MKPAELWGSILPVRDPLESLRIWDPSGRGSNRSTTAPRSLLTEKLGFSSALAGEAGKSDTKNAEMRMVCNKDVLACIGSPLDGYLGLLHLLRPTFKHL